MKPLIFDIETNHRQVDRVTRVWCICAITPDGQELRFAGRSIGRGVELLRSSGKLIGHNIHHYDLPVLERLYGFRANADIVDTLILSRLLFNGLSEGPDRFGRHGLDAWGKRLGRHKGDFQEFSKFSAEMVDYCLQDCRVTAQMLAHFRKQPFLSPEAVALELDYAAFLRQVERRGFSLDVPGVEQLIQRLDGRIESVQRKLDNVFPPQFVESGKPEYYTYEHANGTLFNLEFPREPTKTALEKWRRSQGIRRQPPVAKAGTTEQNADPVSG